MVSNSTFSEGLATPLGSVDTDHHNGFQTSVADSSVPVSDPTTPTQFHVYSVDSFAPHDVEWLDCPKATFTKIERATALDSLRDIKTPPQQEPGIRVNAMYAPGEAGQFEAVDLYVIPDSQVADFTNLNFEEECDRAYTRKVLDTKPRLAVMNLTLEASSGKGLENLHSRWVQHIVNYQHEQGKGFLVTKSGSEDGQEVADQITQLPDVTVLPVESCQHGLISLDTNTYSSVICNVPEITSLLRQGSEKILGRKTSNVVSPDTQRLFSPILQSLQFYGWSRKRANGTSMQAYLAEHTRPELCTNHARTADGIIDWLITEELCDLDYKNHNFLSEHYPTVTPQSAPTETTEERDQRRSGIAEDLRQPDPGLGVSPAELVAPSVGEDLGDR